MALLKQSTAYTRLFKMISSVDHFSLKTGLTPTVNISKAGAAFGAAAGAVVEVASGWYKVSLTTADTNTLGDLAYYITAALADDTDFCDQISANILGDVLSVNMTQILGTAVSAPATAGILDVNVKNIDNDAASASGTVTFPNATLASTTNITAGTISTVTTLTNLPSIPANWITATGINADAITAAKIADGAIDAATFAVGAINAAAIAADAITDAKVAADVTIASVTGAVGSVTGAVGSVTGAVGSVTAAVTVGTINANVITATAINADAITAAKIADGAIDAATFAAGAINAAAIAADAITDAKVAADVTIASVTGAVGSVTAGVTVTTNNDKTGYTLSAAGTLAIWDKLTSALIAAGSIGKLLVDNVDATISSRLSSAGYTAPDNTSITAIKTQTDKLTFTVANQVDSNVQYVNDTIVKGNGSLGTEWGPGP